MRYQCNLSNPSTHDSFPHLTEHPTRRYEYINQWRVVAGHRRRSALSRLPGAGRRFQTLASKDLTRRVYQCVLFPHLLRLCLCTATIFQHHTGVPRRPAS